MPSASVVTVRDGPVFGYGAEPYRGRKGSQRPTFNTQRSTFNGNGARRQGGSKAINIQRSIAPAASTRRVACSQCCTWLSTLNVQGGGVLEWWRGLECWSAGVVEGWSGGGTSEVRSKKAAPKRIRRRRCASRGRRKMQSGKQRGDGGV